MIEERHIWHVWARRLQGWGVRPFAAWILEATAPLHILGAQLVYVGQPLLGLFWAQEQVDTLAEVLEKPDEARALIRYLREEAPA